jgi:hypothetical protein
MARKALPKQERELGDLLAPTVRLFCEDVAQGQDGSYYIARIIDQIGTQQVPVTAHRFIVFMEFEKAANVFDSDIRGLKLALRLTAPDEATHEVGTLELLPTTDRETAFQRIVMNMPGITFNSWGIYTFSLHIMDDKREALLAARQLKVFEMKMSPEAIDDTE